MSALDGWRGRLHTSGRHGRVSPNRGQGCTTWRGRELGREGEGEKKEEEEEEEEKGGGRKEGKSAVIHNRKTLLPEVTKYIL